MKARVKIIAFGAVAIAGMAIVVAMRNGPDETTASAHGPLQTASSHESSRVVGKVQPGTESSEGDIAARNNQQLAEASQTSTGAGETNLSDLHLEGFLAFERIPAEHTQSIVVEAEAGNSTAQYSLAKLLVSCRHMLQQYPDQAALAEFTQRAGGQRNRELVEGVEREARACWDLSDSYSERGRTPQEWMQLAAEGGYGPALAAMAGAWAWEVPLPEAEAVEAEMDRRRTQRSLVAAAVKTLDPNALFAVSGLFGKQGPLTRGRPGESLAWVYAACHFGLECGPDNWYLQWRCRYLDDCGAAYAGSLPAYMEYHEYSPAAADNAEQRAPELIQQLESGDWEALNLRFPDDPPVREALRDAEELRRGNSEVFAGDTRP